MKIENCWYKNKCTTSCKPSCIRYNCMKALFELSNVPEYMWEYRNLRCERSDYEAFKTLAGYQHNIVDFVENGNNLYIYSEICGNGKTSWAVRLLYSYFDSIWHKSGFECHGLFINVPQFLYMCKRSISVDVKGFEELCNNIAQCELVIWDDLPSSEFTGYEHQIILQYIDGRINAGKANIFTGNCGKDKCYQLLGDRLASRVFGCSKIVQFVEQDKRGA